MSDNWNYSVVELVLDNSDHNRPAISETDIHVGIYLDCGYEILAVWAEPSRFWFLGKTRRKMLVRQKVTV